MVDVKELRDAQGRPAYKVTSDKTQVTYTILPTQDGYIFYEILPTSGSLPSALVGKYSSGPNAVKALTKYLNGIKKTPTTRVKENSKRGKNAASKPDSSDDVQQRVGD